MLRKGFVSLVFLGLLSGCASTTENLQRETAFSLGVAPETVSIKNVERAATTVTWLAETSEAAYACTADDMIRRLNCRKTGK